jgi:hypothetical protein
MCHDIHAMFHIDWFSHSKLDREDTQTHGQHEDSINVPPFSQVRNVG